MIFALAAAPAPADQIVVQGANHPGAKITDFDGGQLRYLSSVGELEQAWIDDIDMIIVDRADKFADFNQAETYLSKNEPDRAIERYRRALHPGQGFWPELIESRLLVACRRAGRLVETTRAWIKVAEGRRSGLALAARLLPEPGESKGEADIHSAVRMLDDAVAKWAHAEGAETQGRRAVFQLLRYELLRSIGDPRTKDAIAGICTFTLSRDAGTESIYQILLNAMQACMEESATSERWEALDEAIQRCPSEILPEFLLLKGRTLLRGAKNEDDYLRASWPFLRVAIHMDDDPRAAEGLYGAALALERSGRVAPARKLLEECLGHKLIDSQTRAEAKKAMERMQDDKG